jgi:hypothetical protein
MLRGNSGTYKLIDDSAGHLRYQTGNDGEWILHSQKRMLGPA